MCVWAEICVYGEKQTAGAMARGNVAHSIAVLRCSICEQLKTGILRAKRASSSCVRTEKRGHGRRVW